MLMLDIKNTYKNMIRKDYKYIIKYGGDWYTTLAYFQLPL